MLHTFLKVCLLPSFVRGLLSLLTCKCNTKEAGIICRCGKMEKASTMAFRKCECVEIQTLSEHNCCYNNSSSCYHIHTHKHKGDFCSLLSMHVWHYKVACRCQIILFATCIARGNATWKIILKKLKWKRKKGNNGMLINR